VIGNSMPGRAITPRKHRRLAASERRQSLIEAALDCLSRLGPDGAGVREICDPADPAIGASKAAETARTRLE
jgi:AcrR family transcriptional regulator